LSFINSQLYFGNFLVLAPVIPRGYYNIDGNYLDKLKSQHTNVTQLHASKTLQLPKKCGSLCISCVFCILYLYNVLLLALKYLLGEQETVNILRISKLYLIL